MSAIKPSHHGRRRRGGRGVRVPPILNEGVSSPPIVNESVFPPKKWGESHEKNVYAGEPFLNGKSSCWRAFFEWMEKPMPEAYF